MKKGKLLFLLVAILSLAILFAACDSTGGEELSGTGSDSGTEASTAGGTESGADTDTDASTADEGETEIVDEQENANHEMHSYFDLDDKAEADPLASISRIDGEIVQVDDENNLAVIVRKDLDNMSNVVKTVEVYDLLTGEVIRTDSVTYPYGGYPNDIVELDVSIIYPVIKVQKTSRTVTDNGVDIDDRGDDTYETSYSVSYYLACKDGELLHSTDSTECDTYEYDNGLVCVEMGDRLVWIDKNLNQIRQVEKIFADYNYSVYPWMFDSEYKGYLYSYDDSSLMIFNHAGMACGTYRAGEDSRISCFVLDNGDVLIQEFTSVGIYESCDFVIMGTRYTMKSMIMDVVDGSVTEVELDFIVNDLESEYGQESHEPRIKLANGRDNLAVVYKVADGYVSQYASVCVLDNDCNVVYTVKNDTDGVTFEYGMTYIGNGKYIAGMNSDGYYWEAIFDLDGNFISAVSFASNITDKYIVSDKAIYNYKMELVYDMEANGYIYEGIACNKIYLSKINFESGAEELYVFTYGAKQPELLVDGIQEELEYADEYVYVVYNVEDDVYVVYNHADEELLVSHERVMEFECDGVYLISTTFNGEPVVYVVK